MARLDDGYSSRITFAGYSFTLYEKSVKPPSIEGGGAIDTTTMHNSVWRTKAPKSLKTMGNVTFRAAYDNSVQSDIQTAVNDNVLITVKWPDDTFIQFYGFIDVFDPAELVEGEQPEANVTVIPTLQTDAGVETLPVIG